MPGASTGCQVYESQRHHCWNPAASLGSTPACPRRNSWASSRPPCIKGWSKLLLRCFLGVRLNNRRLHRIRVDGDFSVVAESRKSWIVIGWFPRLSGRRTSALYPCHWMLACSFLGLGALRGGARRLGPCFQWVLARMDWGCLLLGVGSAHTSQCVPCFASSSICTRSPQNGITFSIELHMPSITVSSCVRNVPSLASSATSFG